MTNVHSFHYATTTFKYLGTMTFTMVLHTVGFTQRFLEKANRGI